MNRYIVEPSNHKFYVTIKQSNKSRCVRPLPTPAGIGYRRKALAKFSLLALGVPLLVCLTCLLLGTRT